MASITNPIHYIQSRPRDLVWRYDCRHASEVHRVSVNGQVDTCSRDGGARCYYTLSSANYTTLSRIISVLGGWF